MPQNQKGKQGQSDSKSKGSSQMMDEDNRLSESGKTSGAQNQRNSSQNKSSKANSGGQGGNSGSSGER